MSTRDTILVAALKLLEEGGGGQFSTRTVCAMSGVTAPTLYHHFGSADGLLSAAIAEAFSQFLASKRAAIKSTDPETALREGWDDYVRFASARPLLFTAMLGRYLDGAQIDAAEEGKASLRGLVKAVADQGTLTLPLASAADLIWSSANAAALLFATAATQKTPVPKAEAINALREAAMQAVLSGAPKTGKARTPRK